MIRRIAAIHSVAPIISDPRYVPKTLNCQLISGLWLTSGTMPSAPGAVILNLPAHSNITIIPMLHTRKGIFRSATTAAIFVRTLSNGGWPIFYWRVPQIRQFQNLGAGWTGGPHLTDGNNLGGRVAHI